MYRHSYESERQICTRIRDLFISSLVKWSSQFLDVDSPSSLKSWIIFIVAKLAGVFIGFFSFLVLGLVVFLYILPV